LTYKSITPIISTILLILITIITSTAAYFWMMDVMEQIQQDTEENINSNPSNDLTDFTLVSVSCNSTINSINITVLNNGIGDIGSGTSILIFADSTNSAELYTYINSSFIGLNEGQAAVISYTSSYDLIVLTTYVTRLTLSNSKTHTLSCKAQQ
jgi:flagellin-like protein